ncbi:hypothetical protein HAT91_02523 [Dickeya solani]|nr:hypothetical protein HAT91_02523 [Dickeya solani]
MNHNRTRVYPETKACIDLYSKANGFIPVISWRDKSIGIPTIAGMSEKRQEFGVSANELITIRVLYPGEADNKYFFSSGVNVAQSVITFKPEVGSFCYVTIDFKHQESKTGKYLRVYKIVDNAAGKKELQHVNILNVPNCPGQQPWYTQMGAVM